MNPFRRLARALGRVVTGRRLPFRKSRLEIAMLEDRVVPATLDIRSIDGSGNNLTNSTLGQAGTSFIRIAPAQYADGISTPAGSDRPSARVISNGVADSNGQEIISDQQMAAMMYAWGQFIDHDLDLTPTGTTESLNIAVPTGDVWFDPNSTGTQVIPMNRSTAATGTGTSKSNPRQQIDAVTPWLDGSMIYGSDVTTARSLRTLSGGLMKTSANNLLPTDASGNFLAGDTRVNENPELTSLQTLFVREHNRIAAQIAKSNPKLTDEEIYQKARAWVIAEVQVITYKEWLPALTGSSDPYRGYDPKANPAISNEFATAGFRIGHSMLGDDIEFLGNDGVPIRDAVSLADSFFNPSLITQNNIDPILKYLTSDPSSQIDTKVVDSVRNFLFGAPGSGGLDLASLNIQRGRDHGLADYNTTRAALGLPKVTSFSQITSDTALAAKLQSLYGNVNKIDLWVGVLAENHVANGNVGPTAKAIITEQFNRIRAADRFWYQRTFSGADLQALEGTTLSQIIARNTKLTTVQPNAFFFKAEIAGSVFGDANRDGALNGREGGLANRTVTLVDALSGDVVATKTTDAQGRFKFGVQDGLRTGRYLIQVTLNTGEVATTSTTPIAVNTDRSFRADVGLFRGQAQPPSTPPRPPAPQNPGMRTAATSTPQALFLPPVLMGVALNDSPLL